MAVATPAGPLSRCRTVALSLPALGAPTAPSVTFARLALLNGWGTYPFGSGSPAVADISGIVSFKGAISASSASTSNVAFVLPPGLRPARYVNVPVDMCNATGGELNIAPAGVTQVISEGANTNVTCFTSLDGVSFALSTASFTTLGLRPGWTDGANSGRKAAARVVDGIVHLAGAIRTVGTNPAAFTLPAGFRPAKDVFVTVDLCSGSKGRLDMQPDGGVKVEAEHGDFNKARCFTSLDGASFAG